MRLSSKKKLRSFALSFLVGSGVVLAQHANIPLTNWTAPPYQTSSARGGLSTMTDVTPAVSFVGVAPCRLVDTRPASGFPAGYGPPSMAGGAPRNFDLNSQPNCTGIPSGVEAYSLNVTVTNTLGAGFILIYPQGGAQPTVSTVNYIGGQTIANAAIVPAGTGGGVTVIAGVSGTDLIIDINGYFTDVLNTDVEFVQIGSVDGSGVIYGQNNSAVTGSSGILGWAGSGTNNAGVEGRIFANAAVGSAGVHGVSTTGPNITYGGEFENSNTTTESAAVIGDGDNTTGETYGVLGDNDSATNCSAGVWGRSGANLACNLFVGNMGVIGTNTGLWGVLGTSNNAVFGRGVQGSHLNAGATAITTSGALGYVGTSGVHSFQDISKVGSVAFVEPHPNDASKQITYTSLEGREVGTYFRGKGKFERGVATIDVPEDFRMVTESEGLSIQVTPIGEMATYAVVSIGLDRILVRGSRNVEFFYTVNGIRSGHAGFQPIAENIHFVPVSANDRMLEHMPATRQKLMKNGVLGSNGKANMETARRLGWTQQWEKEQLRIEAEQAADREANRQGVPEGSIQPALTPD